MQTSFNAPKPGWKSGFVLALIALPAMTWAAEGGADQALPRLGLSPGEPQVRSATPSLPFGINPATSREYVLDFHGYLLLPAQLGLHKRPTTQSAQSGTVLHAPPLMAQDLRSFEYTGAIPTPWLQLNFVYGNSTISATTILAGTSATDGAGYFNPVEQFGVNDAYITANLTKPFGFPFQLHVGAMTGRYGAMGAWDAGRYGTPLIARSNTIGETIVAGKKFGDFFLIVEQGLGGQIGRPPVGMVSSGWNNFTNDNVGATFVNQLHIGLAYTQMLRFGLHYMTAWTQDDLVNDGNIPDGRITVLGADGKVAAGRFGHAYVGMGYTKATNAAPVSGAIEVLNARGGPELIEQYLGPKSNGTGSLTTVGAQYDLSVARVVYGDLYTGESPDILVSLFGVLTSVKSNDKDYDGVTKAKLGMEAAYLPYSWFGVSERIDHVRLHGGDTKKALTIISTRILLHTNWKSRDELALQHSYFSYGSGVQVKSGYPPIVNPELRPDRHVLSLTGTFWW